MFNKMDAAEIGAMAAGQTDAAGPTMMFAQVGLGVEAPEPGGEGGVISKGETDDVGGRLQQVSGCWTCLYVVTLLSSGAGVNIQLELNTLGLKQLGAVVRVVFVF